MIQDMENECDISGSKMRFLRTVLDRIQLSYWLRYHENPQTTQAVTKTKDFSGKKYGGGELLYQGQHLNNSLKM